MPDRIEDVEVILSDAVAPACGAAQHLFKKDARADPAEKDQVADFRHIDAGGEQIHGDGDIGQPLVLELPDHAFGSVDGARDLGDGVVGDGDAAGFELLLEDPYDHVGMIVGGGEDEGFLFAVRIEMFDQFLRHGAVEVFRQHQLVEVVDLELHLIGNVFDVGDLPGGRIVDRNGVAFFPLDALFGKAGDELMGRFMVHQPAVDDGLPVGVCIDTGLPKISMVCGAGVAVRPILTASK